MRKCPDCAKENINESLFCKHCGHCLLSPDPEEGQWSTAMQTEDYRTPEGIEFYDDQIIKKSGVASLKRRHWIGPSIVEGWLLLLNLLVLILMFEIVRYIIIK